MSEQSKAADKPGAYARVYWHAFRVQYGRELFKQSRVDWSRLKRSIGELSVEHPSPDILTRATLLACTAGDREETKQLFLKSAEPLSFYPYAGAEERDACRIWAFKTRFDILYDAFWENVWPIIQVFLVLRLR